MSLTVSIVEDAALTWFGGLGYAVGHRPQMAPGEPAMERVAGTHIERRMEDGLAEGGTR